MNLVTANKSIKIIAASSADGAQLVPAKPVRGISYNVFSRFDLANTNLRIYNGGQGATNNGSASLIVIQATNIKLSANIEIIGRPADILFITNSTRTNSINCQQCSFSNVGRATFAAATTKSVSSILASGTVNNLVTNSTGSVTVNGLSAPGLQSLELMANTVQTAGTIDINLRADIHPQGGHIIHPQGSKIVGSGGISLYAGLMTIGYEKLKVSAATVVNQAFVVGGKLRAASIAVVSPKHITLATSANLSTLSDIIATSTHNNDFYAPIEGIYIQGVGKHTSSAQHNVTLSGKLFSDNRVSIKSLNKVNLHSAIVTKDLSVIAATMVRNKGSVQAQQVEIAANTFINNGQIAATDVAVETQQSIYNSFGGNIKSNTLILKSNNGAVVNGSRSHYENYANVPTILPISIDMTAKKYGIFYDINEKRGTFQKNVSAHIVANDLTIVADVIENINPYFIDKLPSANWDAGISINNAQAKQVSIEAEYALDLKGYKYIVNASAIIGLHENGQANINTPTFSNERYKIQFETYVYRRVDYSHDKNKTNKRYNSGTTSKILAYSPPGRLFSFGRFIHSYGLNKNQAASTRAVNKEVQSINEMSYFEVFNDSHFYKGKVSSIGLELTKEYTSVDINALRGCLTYRHCEREDITTSIEAETLFAVTGNIYGVKKGLESNTDLDIVGIGPMSNDARRVVNKIVDEYIATHTTELNGYAWGNKPDVNVFSWLENVDCLYRATCSFEVLSSEIVGDLVQGQIAIKKITYLPPYGNYTASISEVQQFKTYQFKVNFQQILDAEMVDRDVDGTSYTHRQLTTAVENFVLQAERVVFPSGLNTSYKYRSTKNDLTSVKYFVDGAKLVINYMQIDDYARKRSFGRKSKHKKTTNNVTASMPLSQVPDYL
ncbi:hypothetical protein HQQ94_11315 [Shewanella sp. VB17]|uniref:hypothetical protein n=1 Tax=Shewanella sp. VB17 TaxID=2739432 RepID=UPI0015660700|nr:hypothetical protein [Shewanella sp. VB17]NRD73816.1 hypothetical protein [Shewanella sp. VB17]